ncbi:MAG: hypothetical protein ACLVLH_10425 [Eisenbergiella massiliensis]
MGPTVLPQVGAYACFIQVIPELTYLNPACLHETGGIQMIDARPGLHPGVGGKASVIVLELYPCRILDKACGRNRGREGEAQKQGCG